jgi:hypothetical protein
VLVLVDNLLGAVIGIVGGSGGVGASRFAAVLAATAAVAFGRSLLVDLDPVGGGIDVLIGIESTPGPRWSSLQAAGGFLDPALLLAGLPAWGRVAVLACDQAALETDVVSQVVDAACRAGPVVLDLPRHRCAARDAAVSRCGFVGLVAASDVTGLTAARRIRADLDGAPVAVIARGARGSAHRSAELIGAPLAGRLPAGRRRDGTVLRYDRSPGPMRRIARGVLEAVCDSPDAPDLDSVARR